MDTRHEVFNRPVPLSGCNLFEGYKVVQDAPKFNASGPETAAPRCLGAQPDTPCMQAHARLANAHTPELPTQDRFGQLLARNVEPAWLAAPLCQASPGAVANAFCDSCLAGHGGAHF